MVVSVVSQSVRLVMCYCYLRLSIEVRFGTRCPQILSFGRSVCRSWTNSSLTSTCHMMCHDVQFGVLPIFERCRFSGDMGDNVHFGLMWLLKVIFSHLLHHTVSASLAIFIRNVFPTQCPKRGFRPPMSAKMHTIQLFSCNTDRVVIRHKFWRITHTLASQPSRDVAHFVHFLWQVTRCHSIRW